MHIPVYTSKPVKFYRVTDTTISDEFRWHLTMINRATIYTTRAHSIFIKKGLSLDGLVRPVGVTDILRFTLHVDGSSEPRYQSLVWQLGYRVAQAGSLCPQWRTKPAGASADFG